MENVQIPFPLQPMLATLVAKPFHRPGWVYEEKYDGYRVLAYKEGKRVTRLSRAAHDCTGAFSVIADAVATLTPRTLLLDGEVVAYDRKLVSRFQLLQRGDPPPVFAVFDCLYVDGRDLRKAPLVERRTRPETVVGRSDRILPARRLASDGLAAYGMARRKGLEGIIAKDSGSAYEERRSSKWLKIKVHLEEEFIIEGYTRPAGSRSNFGALLLGAFKGDELCYVGKVGSGFSRKGLSSLWRQFQPFVVEKALFVNPPREYGVTWLAPRLVAQVGFHEWTQDGRLRAPAFLGLRDDKKPKDCLLPRGIGFHAIANSPHSRRGLSP